MAYNIVKHRRGTTQEWIEIDLILEAGELAIEECGNGICRCKIGDGVHKFSYLKYVDEYSLEELSRSLSELRSFFIEKFSNVDKQVSETKTTIFDLEQKLINKIIDESKALAVKYEIADQQVQINLIKDIDNKLATLKETINNSINAAALNLESYKSENDFRITNLYNDINNKFTYINNDLTSLATTLNNSVKELETRVESEFVEAESQLDSISVELSDLKQAQHNSKIDISANKAKLEKIDDALLQQSKELADLAAISRAEDEQLLARLDVVDNNITDIYKNIEVTAGSLAVDYESKITEAIDNLNLEQALSSLASKQSNNLTSAKNHLQDQINHLAAQNDTHAEKLNIATDSIAAHAENINQIKEDNITTAQNVSSLSTQLETLQNKITGLNNSNVAIIDKVFSISNNLSDLNSSMVADIDELRTACSQADYMLSEKITEVEKTSQASDIELLNIIHNYVSDIYTEILDLVDDDVAIVDRLFYIHNTTLARLDKLEADGVSANTQAIQALSQNLEKNIAALESRLVYITAQQNDIENEFRDNFNSIQLAIEDLQAATVDGQLRTDLNDLSKDVDILKDKTDNIGANLEKLSTIVNNDESGLASTKARADAALVYAGVNMSNIQEIKNNFVKIDSENISIGEEIIIFNCGGAVDPIVIE